MFSCPSFSWLSCSSFSGHQALLALTCVMVVDLKWSSSAELVVLLLSLGARLVLDFLKFTTLGHKNVFILEIKWAHHLLFATKSFISGQNSPYVVKSYFLGQTRVSVLKSSGWLVQYFWPSPLICGLSGSHYLEKWPFWAFSMSLCNIWLECTVWTVEREFVFIVAYNVNYFIPWKLLNVNFFQTFTCSPLEALEPGSIVVATFWLENEYARTPGLPPIGHTCYDASVTSTK